MFITNIITKLLTIKILIFTILGAQPPQQLNPSGDPVPPYVERQNASQPLYPTVPGWVMPPGAEGMAPSAPSKADLSAGFEFSGPQSGTGKNFKFDRCVDLTNKNSKV